MKTLLEAGLIIGLVKLEIMRFFKGFLKVI
jgi:hypothetical protein